MQARARSALFSLARSLQRSMLPCDLARLPASFRRGSACCTARSRSSCSLVHWLIPVLPNWLDWCNTVDNAAVVIVRLGARPIAAATCPDFHSFSLRRRISASARVTSVVSPLKVAAPVLGRMDAQRAVPMTASLRGFAGSGCNARPAVWLALDHDASFWALLLRNVKVIGAPILDRHGILARLAAHMLDLVLLLRDRSVPARRSTWCGHR